MECISSVVQTSHSGCNLCSWRENAFALYKAARSIRPSIYFHASQEAPFPLLTSPSQPAQTARKRSDCPVSLTGRQLRQVAGQDGEVRACKSPNAVHLNFKMKTSEGKLGGGKKVWFFWSKEGMKGSLQICTHPLPSPCKVPCLSDCFHYKFVGSTAISKHLDSQPEPVEMELSVLKIEMLW